MTSILRSSSLLLLLHLLPLLPLSYSESSSSSSSSSVYTNFIQCLVNHTQQTPQQLSQLLHSQTNSSYSTVLQSYIRNRRFNTSTTPKPILVITPSQYSHVQASVLCSKSSSLLLKTRSGGHDYEGLSYVSSDLFIVLDMSNFRAVDVDVGTESAWVEAGATLGELYYGIWKKSSVHGFPAGICPTVGVGGHLSGGGYGNMLRKFGLSTDNVIDAKIVNVDGVVLNRSSMGEDLFWAISGGGGASFGVVLAYKVKLVPVPGTVSVFRVEKTIEENATELVYRWQFVAPNTDNDLFMRLLIQPITRKGNKTIRASVLALFLGGADRLVSVLNKEFPELGLRKEDCLEMNWIGSVIWWGDFENGTAPEALLDRMPDSVNFLKRKSDYVEQPISRDNLESLWKKMIELGKPGLVFNPYGGRMSEIPASETPFPHRAGNLFKIQHSISWKEEGPEAETDYMNQIRGLYSYMTPLVSKNPRRAYLNYRDLDIGTSSAGGNSYEEGSVYGVKYFHHNFERLVKVKTQVDPGNFFRNEQSVPPLPRSVSGDSPISGSLRARKLLGAIICLIILEILLA